MASIKRFLSSRVDSAGYSEILLRVIVTRNQIFRIKAGVYIRPEWFGSDGSIVLPRGRRAVGVTTAEIVNLQERLLNVERTVLKCIQENPPHLITRDRLQELTSAKYKKHRQSMDDVLQLYLSKAQPADATRRQLESIFRLMRRWELWRTRRGDNPFFVADIDTLTAKDLENFLDYVRDEPQMYRDDPEFFRQLKLETGDGVSAPAPKPRGTNYLHTVMKKLRIVINWHVTNNHTQNDPFKNFKSMPREAYGTPFYLTNSERNTVAEHDFSHRPGLDVKRDIFIFQCLVGCRVGDLKRFTVKNIHGDFLEYMPSKTKHSSGVLVRVPLTRHALALIDKYRDHPCRPRLFPAFADQNYNEAIKKILLACGIDRCVTILNPVTGDEESRPIYEVASSHMARRTFIGNLYKKVKDPNIIAAMSGHNEGSKAFARYREIDDDIKRETLSLLDS